MCRPKRKRAKRFFLPLHSPITASARSLRHGTEPRLKLLGDGVDLPLIESGMKYLRPLHAGDDFHVVLLIRECEVRLAFDYFIDTLCCLGSTVQCAVSRKTGELEFAMPEHFAECIRRASESEELRVRPWGCFNGRMARRRA